MQVFRQCLLCDPKFRAQTADQQPGSFNIHRVCLLVPATGAWENG